MKPTAARPLIVTTPSGLAGSWFERYYERHQVASFKRLHRQPRAVLKGAPLGSLTPRGAWLLKRSEQRYIKRADAYGLTATAGAEIGKVENFRFISSNHVPNSADY